MEKEMQKLSEKINNKNDKKPKKDFESTLDILKQEHEKSKKIYQTYRGEKLNEKLSKIFIFAKKKIEKLFFYKIKEEYINEEGKRLEVQKSPFFNSNFRIIV